ncbi:hypothetical protein [Hymenobacter sp. B1770]|uniref:hypothetical protein n=1 Tax=Hymenobacter sp. B1770 TaxID=1718788 RepID=UPI003CF4C103
MLRLLCVLLLSAFAVRGQVASPPTAAGAEAPPLAARYPAADTVAAVHRLFKDHRGTGQRLLGGGVTVLAVGAGGVFMAADAGVTYPQNLLVLGGAAVTLALAVRMAGEGLYQVLFYPAAREQRVVAGYEATRALPQHVTRALRPAHFRDSPALAPPR